MDKKQAVAIKYDQKQSAAPIVSAKGQGYVAQNILDAADKNNIPIVQDKTLSGMLMAVEIDRQIPSELYQAVAEVLAYVYRLDQKK